MKKLLICSCLAMALTGCSGQESSTPSQAKAPETAEGTVKAEVAESPTSPPKLNYPDSANETGWFRLDDAATFAAARATHRCSIQRVNNEKPVKGQPVTVSLGEDLTINGWVADTALRTPDRFLVVLRNKQGTYASNAEAGRQRPDVAAALKSEMLADAGFYFHKPLDMVPPGEYSVSTLEFSEGQFSTCGSSARLAVVE